MDKNCLTRFSIILLFLLSSINCIAQIGALQGRIDSLLETKKYKKDATGISFCILKDNKIIYERQFGLANIEKQIPITASTIFNIGSITKQFTAACIFLLENQHKLSTTDSIQKFIPELPSFGYSITLNNLLTHTSGIPDHLEVFGLQNNYNRNRLSADRIISFLNSAPTLSFIPGERFAYCNTGYMLLALVIERVSGMAINTFAQQNIFTPLQMSTASFNKYESDGMNDGTLSYFVSKNKFKVRSSPEPNAIGATGVFGSLRDFVKWNNNFTDNILNKKDTSFIRKMQRSFLLNNSTKTNYGGGLIIKPYKGYISIEHGGGWNDFLAQFRRIPELGITILIASNSNANSPFLVCDQITDLLIPNTSLNNLVGNNNELKMHPSKFEGIFIDPNNVVRQIKFKNDSLKITDLSSPQKNFAYISFKRNIADSAFIFLDNNGDSLEFIMETDSIVKGFYWEGGHYFRYRRFYQGLKNTTLQEINQWAGKYESKELKQKLKIKYIRKENRLKMFPIFFKGYNLEYIGGNVFKVKNEPIYLRFSKDNLELGNEWVFGLRLKRSEP
jgi:CubicO group peptidase (beta-lactamase class C family)